MNSRERLLAALGRKKADGLPMTTHHLMPFFLAEHMNGVSNDAFFDHFGMDPIHWVSAHRPRAGHGEPLDPYHSPAYLEPRRMVSDRWRIVPQPIPDLQYTTARYSFITPAKALTMVLMSDEHTTWVAERLVKQKGDIDVIAAYAPVPECDTAEINRIAIIYGERGIIRGKIVIGFFGTGTG